MLNEYNHGRGEKIDQMGKAVFFMAHLFYLSITVPKTIVNFRLTIRVHYDIIYCVMTDTKEKRNAG